MIEIGSKEYKQLLDKAEALILDEDYPSPPDLPFDPQISADLYRMASYDTLLNNGFDPAEEKPQLVNRMSRTLERRARRLGKNALVEGKTELFNKKLRELPQPPMYRLDPKE